MNNVVGLIVFLSQHLHHSPIMPVLSTCKYICNCCTDYCTVTTAGLPQSTLKPMVQSCENASQILGLVVNFIQGLPHNLK